MLHQLLIHLLITVARAGMIHGVEKAFSQRIATVSSIQVLSKTPAVYTCTGFCRTVCDQYIARPQTLGYKVDSGTFSAHTRQQRTSTTWFMRYQDVPELLALCEDMTGYPIMHMEERPIVKYEMGQQFGWHLDALPPSQCGSAGQRIATLLVYLNDVPDLDGGATKFRHLDLRVQPKAGQALMFFPCSEDGTVDEQLEHAGMMTMSPKWIAQLWLRRRPYTPALPEGTSQIAGETAVIAHRRSQQQSDK